MSGHRSAKQACAGGDQVWNKQLTQTAERMEKLCYIGHHFIPAQKISGLP
jgi:hypothetical protein